MIIIGYQGIGKSTWAGVKGYIDLESSNFWHDGKRPDDWYIYYCNIADHLSSQGYKVFVSSHAEVREYLKYSSELVVSVVPSQDLKDEWIAKLEHRQDLYPSEKNYKALAKARECYTKDVKDIILSGYPTCMLHEMDYTLDEEIERVFRPLISRNESRRV